MSARKDSSDENDEINYARNIQPDRSMSDFYCKICDAHMNTQDVWDMHVKGKRHLKNARKEPDEEKGKIRAVRRDGEPPMIQSRYDEITEPLIGLQYVCELQRSSKLSNCMYTCYLCQNVSDHNGVLDHLVSSKHRLNYIKVVDAHGYALIQSMNLKRSDQDSIAADKAKDIEVKEGRTFMEVKVEKNALDSYGSSSKRQGRDEASTSDHPPAKRQNKDIRHGPVATSGVNPQDIKLFNIETKLKILEELSCCRITNDVEARVTMETVNMLMRCVFRYKNFLSSSMGMYGNEPAPNMFQSKLPSYKQQYMDNSSDCYEGDGQQGGFGGQQSGYGGQQSSYGRQQSGYGGQQSGYGGQQSDYSGLKSGYSRQLGGYAGQQRGFGGQQDGYGGQQGGYGGQRDGYWK